MLRRGRYATNGIMHEVEQLTQYAMWDLIDTLPVPKDYLQVFRLSKVRINGMEMQQIIHEQECPWSTPNFVHKNRVRNALF